MMVGLPNPRIGADVVNPLTTSVFDLPERLAQKADPMAGMFAEAKPLAIS